MAARGVAPASKTALTRPWEPGIAGHPPRARCKMPGCLSVWAIVDFLGGLTHDAHSDREGLGGGINRETVGELHSPCLTAPLERAASKHTAEVFRRVAAETRLAGW
jgi:hypothetical protein